MSSLTFNSLPQDITFYLTHFIPLKDLRSFAQTSQHLRVAVKEASDSCFKKINELPLFSSGKILSSVTYIINSLDTNMGVVLKELKSQPLSSIYNFSLCTLGQLPSICMTIQETLDYSLVEFMESVTIEKIRLIEHNFFEDIADFKADTIREYLLTHEQELNELTGEMTISNTNLYTLPLEIRYFHKISGLSAINCRLNSLPEELGEMNSLCTLDVSNNQLNALPRSLKQLKKLKNIKINFNRFITPPMNLSIGVSCVLADNPWPKDLPMTGWRRSNIRHIPLYYFEGDRRIINFIRTTCDIAALASIALNVGKYIQDPTTTVIDIPFVAAVEYLAIRGAFKIFKMLS